MTTLKVRKIGNSLGTLLPAEVIKHLHVGEGDELFVVEEEGGVKITPYDPAFDAALKAFEEGRQEYRNTLRKLAE